MAYETFLELITIVFRWRLACQTTIEQAQLSRRHNTLVLITVTVPKFVKQG